MEYFIPPLLIWTEMLTTPHPTPTSSTRSSQLEYFIFQLPPCATSADIMRLGHSVSVQSWSLNLGPVLVTQSWSSLGHSVLVQSWSLSLGPVLVTQSRSSLGHSVSVQSWSLSLGPVLVTQSRSSLGHSVSVQADRTTNWPHDKNSSPELHKHASTRCMHRRTAVSRLSGDGKRREAKPHKYFGGK